MIQRLVLKLARMTMQLMEMRTGRSALLVLERHFHWNLPLR